MKEKKLYNVTTYVLSQEVYSNEIYANSEGEAIKLAEREVKERMQPDSWIDYSDLGGV